MFFRDTNFRLTEIYFFLLYEIEFIVAFYKFNKFSSFFLSFFIHFSWEYPQIFWELFLPFPFQVSSFIHAANKTLKSVLWKNIAETFLPWNNKEIKKKKTISLFFLHSLKAFPTSCCCLNLLPWLSLWVNGRKETCISKFRCNLFSVDDKLTSLISLR